MKGPMANLMRQAQEMQEKMKQAQEELAASEVTGQSGAGLVNVTMSGRHEVRRIQIDPSVLKDDPEMLEDLVAAAVNDAVNKVAGLVEERFSGLAGGMGLPGDMKLPF